MKGKDLAKQISELRTDPSLPGAQDINAMNNRVIVLELLYQAARRDDPNNTRHHCYTGLWDGEVPF